jgi:hypothetical protein
MHKRGAKGVYTLAAHDDCHRHEKGVVLRRTTTGDLYPCASMNARAARGSLGGFLVLSQTTRDYRAMLR